jgi:hypothetical protein
MSLTSHIKDGKNSPVGAFLLDRFPKTVAITRDANFQLKSAPPNPWPAGNTPYTLFGMAIDYRIRYSFAITPAEDLTAWWGAWELVLLPPDTPGARHLPGDVALEIWSHMPAGAGFRFDPGDGAARGPYSVRFIKSFFHELNRTLRDLRPAGRRLDFQGECLLARYCFVLSLFEVMYRAGFDSLQNGPLLMPAPKRSVEELLDSISDEWAADLAALSWLFFDSCSHLLSRPAVLNPIFYGSRLVEGADADLVVDGCLIEVKASGRSELRTEWLRQLAGYLLLDLDDTYRITSLGIYMARQGMLLTWPVEQFISKLTGDSMTTLAALRQDFRALFPEPEPNPRRTQSPAASVLPPKARTRRESKDADKRHLNIFGLDL